MKREESWVDTDDDADEWDNEDELDASWTSNRYLLPFSSALEHSDSVLAMIPCGLDEFVQDNTALSATRLAIATLELFVVLVIRSTHE